jgi:hypothetical protein
MPIPKTTTKRAIKRAYLAAEIGVTDAVLALMLDFGMERGHALTYLGVCA